MNGAPRFVSGVMALSRRAQVQWDSISTRPISPVAQWLKLLQGQYSGLSTRPRSTGLRWMYWSFSTNLGWVKTLKS